jgi:hypothetical protein
MQVCFFLSLFFLSFFISMKVLPQALIDALRLPTALSDWGTFNFDENKNQFQNLPVWKTCCQLNNTYSVSRLTRSISIALAQL